MPYTQLRPFERQRWQVGFSFPHLIFRDWHESQDERSLGVRALLLLLLQLVDMRSGDRKQGGNVGEVVVWTFNPGGLLRPANGVPNGR